MKLQRQWHTGFEMSIAREVQAQLCEQFGEARLAELLVEHKDRPIEEILQSVLSSVREWADGLEDQDDTTMLLVRRL